MSDVKSGVATIIAIAAILLAIFIPFIFIWSINTLFNLGIAYGFWEWLAAFCLSSFLSIRHVNAFSSK